MSRFFFRRKRGSSHFRKLLGITTLPDTSRNINRFADIIDIVINGEQSKFLNQLWTNGLFNNRERTVLFKLYNNTLGYNAAVAHFVRNHSPICTFCDIMEEQDQNRETPVHLFFECGSVSDIIDNTFKKLTNNPNFLFSRREFFATFDRREFSIASYIFGTVEIGVLSRQKITAGQTWKNEPWTFVEITHSLVFYGIAPDSY